MGGRKTGEIFLGVGVVDGVRFCGFQNHLFRVQTSLGRAGEGGFCCCFSGSPGVEFDEVPTPFHSLKSLITEIVKLHPFFLKDGRIPLHVFPWFHFK